MPIEDMLHSAFAGQVLDYKHLLSLYYPAHGSTGFTERNQTCAFVSNLLRCLGKEVSEEFLQPFVWYEAPILHGRVDAVVFAPAQEAVFFIEAKRLNEESKKKELVGDAKRLLKSENRDPILKKWDWKKQGLPITKQYIVCLADVWVKKHQKSRTAWRQNVPTSWWEGQWNQDDTFVSKLCRNGWSKTESGQRIEKLDFTKTEYYYLMMGFSRC